MVTVGTGMGLGAVMGWLFYRHVIGCLVMVVIMLPLWIWLDGKRRREKENREMAMHFQDALSSMVSAMQAGYSLEHAVPYALEELGRLYPRETKMETCLQEVCTRIGVSETAEQAFLWLAKATGLLEVQEFVQVLVTTKRTGGNLIKVMIHTVDQMAKRREVEREIRTLVAGKRLEASLLCGMPLGILLYLQLAMPTLLEPLYHNPKGILIMTGILLGYGGGCAWTGKILQIKI